MDSRLDSEQLIPPSAPRVAARALALATVTCRAQLERDDDAEEAEIRHHHLCRWLDRLGIAEELEKDENALIRAPIGRLNQQSLIDATWRSEGLLVLGWSLGRAEMVRHDEQCDPAYLASEVGWLRERSDTVLTRPLLRERTLIEHWANTYCTIHWRLRQYGIDRGPIDFPGLVARANWGPLTLADVDLIEGDLSIRGERIDRVPTQWQHAAQSIVQERHQAFNWLLGIEPIYSLVPTDT